MLILIGSAVLAILVIVTVVVLLMQRGGSGRRTTPSHSATAPQRGQRRGPYVPPAKAPVILPPSPQAQAGSTNVPPRATRWDSGMTGVVPPDGGLQTTSVAPGPSMVSAAHRLSQEATKLRGSGYNTVTLARRPDIEEYCLLVRVARSDGENVSIHLICGRDYPASPPRMVATIETFNSHGELAEQRLALESPVLRAWGPASSLLAIINNVLSTLPLASPDRSPPTAEFIFSRYTDVIA